VEDDTEMVGGANEYGGVLSTREMSEESRRRRSTRVSWYNKDVENAAAYEYSRNARSRSGSGKQAAFRVRSDSRGSDDGLQLDDVQVVGGDGDVSVDDLAEIGIVMDAGNGTADDEDSYVMDGHKVKAVKQVREVDAEDVGIDDSAMASGRSQLSSREFSRSERSEESVSRHSVSEMDNAPVSLQYQAEVSQSRAERPTTPHTPRSGKKAFIYK